MMNRENLKEGMTVRSADGDKLGTIVGIYDGRIEIEKGIFFPKEYTASFDQLDEVSGDDVYLNWGTHLVESRYDELYGAGSYEKETADEEWMDYERPSSRLGAQPQASTGGGQEERQEEQRVPVREEELEAHRKGMEEKGRVRISKHVKTEDKHFTVPVTREEVHIERVPGTGAGSGALDEGAFGGEFRDEDITIPIREEEIEVSKRPVLKEEIRVKKSTEEVGKDVRGKVRKEEVDIDREGSKKKAG
jgi:uncharacterized protein (TIGR02271 family)